MRFLNLHRQLVCLLMLLLPLLVMAEVDMALEQASQLIKSGEYQSAYTLLEPLETARAGEERYDYLLGVAAVESGNVTRGVFALERVLALQPDHQNARAEMAKAHFKLGEIDASKAEFQNLLNQKPTQEVTNAIERYVTAIDKSQGLATTFGAFLDVGLGYDSNVNSATSVSSFAVPLFGGAVFTLANSGKEKSDNFMGFSGGLSVRHPFTHDISAFASVTGNNRVNGSQTAFDTSALDFNAGFQFKRYIDVFTLAAQDGHFDVNGESYRRAYGIIAQWQRNFDDKNQGNLYTQASRLSYAGSEIRDADRFILGGGWAHVFAGDQSPVVFFGVYAGKEDARDNNADYLDNHLYGLRVGGQMSLTTKLIAFVSTSFEKRNFQAKDPVFLVDKEDKQYDATIGLRYIPARDWSIRPQLSYINTDSNIVLYDFDRYVISINARKEFNW